MSLALLRNWKVLLGGAVLGLLLIAIGVQTMRLNDARGTIETLRNEMAACEAARRVQNEAVRRLEAEGERQREAFEQAVRAGQEGIRNARRQSAPLRNLPANNCPTPPSIMEAPL